MHAEGQEFDPPHLHHKKQEMRSKEQEAVRLKILPLASESEAFLQQYGRIAQVVRAHA